MVQKRGQAAIEFMSTYGWAVIITTVALSALYFMVLQPNQLIPNKCTFINEFECLDAQLLNYGSQKIINLSVVNRMDTTVTISRVLCIFEGEENMTTQSPMITLAPGSSDFVYCEIPTKTENKYVEGLKANARITIIYTKEGFTFPGASDGTVVGTIVNS